MENIKKILRGLFIFILIIFLFYGIQYTKYLINTSDQKRSNESISSDFVRNPVKSGPLTDKDLRELGYESIDDILYIDSDENWAYESFDTEGMSSSETKKMESTIGDKSDSDRDGLTDKEEIEIYNSNPLKASTSGDLYTDKVKIERGMDINKYYEYKGDLTFKKDNPSEIFIEPANALDFYFEAYDVTTALASEMYLDGHTAYKVYDIDFFYGAMHIDISDILKENNINSDDVKILICYDDCGGGLSYAKFTITENEIVLNSDQFENVGTGAFIAIVDRLSLISKIVNQFTGNYEDSKTEQTLIVGSPILSVLGIKMLEMDTKESKLGESITSKINEYAGIPLIYRKGKNPVSKSLQDIIYSQLKIMFPSFEFNKDGKLRYSIFTYSKEMKEVEEISSFSIRKDTLPFKNFGSYINHKGNCVGIAHLTSLLYNKGTIPAKGMYHIHSFSYNGNIEWKIIDNNNLTLIDKGLSDFRNKDYFSEKIQIIKQCPSHPYENPCTIINNNLCDEVDIEFIAMIGCFWQEGNDKIRSGEYENRNISVESARKVIKELGNGEVLDVFIHFGDGKDEINQHRNHAVNAYGCHRTRDGAYRIGIYDNNFPGRKLSMTLEIKNNSVEYTYHPFKENNKYKCVTGDGIAFVDGNWNMY